MSKENIHNRSLERALQILCSFTKERQALGLKEISLATALSKSTVYRLCVTLVQFDFLQYDEKKGKYSLGLKLFDLGGIVFSSFSLRKAADAHLTQLQESTGESVFLGVLRDDFLMYLDKRDSDDNPIRFRTDIGTVRQPYFGMMGQVLLSFLDETEVDRILKKRPLKPITGKSISTREDLHKRLDVIRTQGFAFEVGEVIDGVGGIAAPIFNYEGKVIAAVGIRFIHSSANEERAENLIELVGKTAKSISADLGYLKGKR
ncbi:IclR family transcriptional regulator [Desulfosarcina ovata subsp. sediminis]|uniref:IclR family transcriptional regulator n=1 Tax=Desulfosarcina ovata subsp. sediminis TaxID=885957 RepID=A0A5K8A0Q2_9BACT|nr:IclR family transcriptional regulator [Desulfosarcina ovata]BBO85964.1 IclR family transcriptional regulator [Desulfosarcina ovata subsp. sediminis]